MDQETNVLIVDDESRIVRTLARLLKPHYNTFLAESGEEALGILRSNRIHIILSDQRMPGMTGVELLSKVKELSKNTTRILLTGYSDLTAVMKSVNEGEIFRYITKPWNNRELLAVMDQAATISHMLFQFKPVKEDETETMVNKVLEKKGTILALDPNNELTDTLQGLVGKKADIVTVDSPLKAMDYLAQHSVNIIIAETSDTMTEDLAFIKVAKANYPAVLSLVITEKGDSSRLIGLINEGQIYRYLTKPYSLGQLKLYLLSSMRYQKKLQDQPILTKRHQVEEIKDEEVRKVGQSFMARIKSFFKTGTTSPAN